MLPGTHMPPIPILYSLQNCPYAIRARFALFRAQKKILILQIMIWALTKQDAQDLLHSGSSNALSDMLNLIAEFEKQFIPALEAYCCAKRYHGDNLSQCRETCEVTLKQLEQRLATSTFLFSQRESLLDIALFPFLRKFARVERQWYLQSPYPKLRDWLNCYLQSPTFTKVMAKYELWLENHKDIYFVIEN